MYVQTKYGVKKLKPLNVRFSEKVELSISDVNEITEDKKSQSKIARAASS